MENQSRFSPSSLLISSAALGNSFILTEANVLTVKRDKSSFLCTPQSQTRLVGWTGYQGLGPRQKARWWRVTGDGVEE